MIYQSFIISISMFVFLTNVANAYDFYGASVRVKEVSMSMRRMGINGNYPIVESIVLNSPAAKAGMSQGNIILSVNDRVIKTVFDLDAFTTNVLSVKILKGYARETIIIDRIAIEAEKAKRIEAEKKSMINTSAPNRDTEVEEFTNNPMPLVFNDEILEKKLGRSTPAELARQRQVTEQNLQNESNKKLAKIAKRPQGINFADDYYLISSYQVSAPSYSDWSPGGWYRRVAQEIRNVTIQQEGDDAKWSFDIHCQGLIFSSSDMKMSNYASQKLYQVVCPYLMSDKGTMMKNDREQ